MSNYTLMASGEAAAAAVAQPSVAAAALEREIYLRIYKYIRRSIVGTHTHI